MARIRASHSDVRRWSAGPCPGPALIAWSPDSRRVRGFTAGKELEPPGVRDRFQSDVTDQDILCQDYPSDARPARLRNFPGEPGSVDELPSRPGPRRAVQGRLSSGT